MHDLSDKVGLHLLRKGYLTKMTIMHENLSRKKYAEYKDDEYLKEPTAYEANIDLEYRRKMGKDLNSMEKLVDEMRASDTSERSEVCKYDVQLRIAKLEQALDKEADR